MSNYRRLISYIYAYEGGVKGKNIGFAKIEVRNGQCRIHINVKKVFLGGSDIGVYLLSSQGEIQVGRIFIRNGAGEFRTNVNAENVENSRCTMEQCYGLSIHEKDNKWRCYTTIWEDAVMQAAEIQLADVTADRIKKQSEWPESRISVAEEIEQELQQEEIRTEREKSDADGKEKAWEEAGKAEQVARNELELKEIQIIKENQGAEENQKIGESLGSGQEPETEGEILKPGIPEKTIPREIVLKEVMPKEITPEEQISSQEQKTEASGKEQIEQQIGESSAKEAKKDMEEQSLGEEPKTRENRRSSRNNLQSMQEKVLQFARAIGQGKNSNSMNQKQEKVSAETVNSSSMPEPGDPLRLKELEQMEWMENLQSSLWNQLQRRYPKVLAFDYSNGCEILSIKPQDIGILPRENWVYGNNSFLLHGYYNYRHLILAKLNNPQGEPRYLLGVPGHYFSNEKNLASMFGFPNFVLAKKQPEEDGRFGYWYTDIHL